MKAQLPRSILSWHWGLLLRLFLLWTIIPDVSLAMTFTIKPYGDECILIHTPKSTAKLYLSGSYGMLENHSELDGSVVLVYIMDGMTEEIRYQNNHGRGRGAFRIPANPSQPYWICVQNNSRGPEDEDGEHPDHQPRTVGLTYQLEFSEASSSLDPLDPHNQKLQIWLDHAGDMQRELRGLLDHFSYMKTREAMQREIVERTFTETMTWTVFEAFMVCLAALGQVFYMRSFLEKKRYM